MSDVMIEARELSKQYPGTTKPVTAVAKASFEVRRGEVVGFLGPNGAGKTTTMKMLTCFIAPTTGTARVNGADVWEDSLAVRSAIGYLPESTPLYTEMLVYEYLQWVARMRGLEGEKASNRIKIAVEQTGLGDVIAKEIRALSKGYRQRVGLAQALLHEPPILILDEPMSGLDPNQALEIRDLIREIGKERTIILSTHNLAEVQATCNRVLIIAQGKIVADDTPDGLKDRAGKRRFVASVLDGDGGKVREAFGRITGVDKVRPLSGASRGELRYELVPVKDEDLRPEIFKAAVDGGFLLVELRSEGQNLENVFRDLTTGDPLAAKGKGKAKAKKKAPEPEPEAEEEQEEKASEEEDAADEDEKASEEDAADEEEKASADEGGDEDDDKKEGA